MFFARKLARRWVLLLLLAWAACSTGNEKHRVGFAGVIPGAGITINSVVSLREQKFLHLVRQQTDYSCGAASLATILKYGFHIDVDEQQVMKGLLSVSDAGLVKKRGFSLLDIAEYVKKFKLSGNGYQIQSHALTQLKVPAIVLINTQGYAHFVVLKRATMHQVYLADPSVGNRSLPIDEFITMWNGIIFVILGNQFDSQSVLLAEHNHVDAMEVLNTFHSETTNRLLNFGFSHSHLLRF